jgi:hypothetical protein
MFIVGSNSDIIKSVFCLGTALYNPRHLFNFDRSFRHYAVLWSAALWVKVVKLINLKPFPTESIFSYGELWSWSCFTPIKTWIQNSTLLYAIHGYFDD